MKHPNYFKIGIIFVLEKKSKSTGVPNLDGKTKLEWGKRKIVLIIPDRPDDEEQLDNYCELLLKLKMNKIFLFMFVQNRERM